MSLGSQIILMIPNRLPNGNPRYWNKDQLATFLKANQDLYELGDSDIEAILNDRYCGQNFNRLEIQDLRGKLSNDGAISVMKLIEALRNIIFIEDEHAYRRSHDDRWKRWQELLKISIEKKKKAKTATLTGPSCLTWSDVEPIYKPLMRAINIELHNNHDIPENILKNLHQSLCSTASRESGDKVFNATGNDANCLHLIAQILVCMSDLFNNKLDVLAKTPVANQFEFLLKQKSIRVCVIVAKKGDMDQGMTQCLLNCEVVANIAPKVTVFGLVTDYIDWVFLQSSSRSVGKEATRISVSGNEIGKAELAVIVRKLYAQLSGDAL